MAFFIVIVALILGYWSHPLALFSDPICSSICFREPPGSAFIFYTVGDFGISLVDVLWKSGNGFFNQGRRYVHLMVN